VSTTARARRLLPEEVSAKLRFEPLILRHFLSRCGRGAVSRILEGAQLPTADVRSAARELLAMLDRGNREM